MLAVLAGCGAQNPSSPSDFEIAYSVVPAEAGAEPGGIFLVDGEGKHQRRLTRVLSPDAEEVHWSPRSDLLLFRSSLSNEIWTIRPDGSDLTKIGVGTHASWSPDGKMIAVGTDDGSVDIRSADGELQKTISPGDAGLTQVSGIPSWSPDGTKVAFGINAEPTTLFVAPVRGEGRAVPVAKSGEVEVFLRPYWSADGELLALESTQRQLRDAAHSIWTIRSDGSQRRRVATNASLRGWAPGGAALLCAAAEPRSLHESRSLYECPLDRGPRRRLSPNEQKKVLERDPRLSPDGRQLATLSAGGAIVVSSADGSRRRALTSPGPYEALEWSPEGARLTFVQDGWVYVIGRDGKGARRLVRGDAATWLTDGARLLVQQYYPEAHFSVATLEGTTRRLAKGWPAPNPVKRGPLLSPDGETIAYQRGVLRGSESTVTIYVIGTRGGPERKVVDIPAADKGEAAELHDLAWSPDGQALFGVWALRGYPDQDASGTLHEIALSGSSKVLAREVVPGTGIAVSPSGDQIAFVGKEGLEVVDLETGKRRPLVRAADPTLFVDPQWSPDGSMLAYLTDTGLATVRADGSAGRFLGSIDEVESFSWRPTGAND